MFPTEQEAAVLFRQVAERGLLSASQACLPGEKIGRVKNPRAVKGQIEVSGRSVTIALVLPSWFPLVLPKIYLLPWDALGFIPHVERDGYVCYATTEGMLIDSNRPIEIIEWAIARAREMLERGVSGANIADFTDEFATYWSRLRGVAKYDSVLEPGREVRLVVVAKTKRNHGVIANSRDEIKAFYHGEVLPPRFEIQEGLYLPLEPGAIVVPPRIGEDMWTPPQLRSQLLPNLSQQNQNLLTGFVAKRRKKDTIIVSIARPSGGESLIAFRATGMSNGHVLTENGTAEQLTPIAIERLDRTYLLPRGGGSAALGTKRVLVVGVGAVGSRVASELARSGVLNLTLVDQDTFSAENTFRHILGQEFWNDPKVTSMKTVLEGDLPYARIVAVEATIQEALGESAPIHPLANYDLIVSATGNPTVELALNRVLRATEGAPPCVFAWLEPYGIGGHALLAGHNDSGCFECLYTAPDGTRQMNNRAAFADKDQEFGRALTGCGSLHMPFASLDAMRTAEMATRLSIQTLQATTPIESLLRSWRGDASDFVAAGFRLTPRFESTYDELGKRAKEFSVRNCPVCGVDQE